MIGTAHSQIKIKRANYYRKSTEFQYMLLISMETFDLIDIQRRRQPNLNIHSHVAKALKVKSRLHFFLIAKRFSQHVKKVGCYPSIAPDNKAIYLDLLLPQNSKRGPGFWKFNSLLQNDKEYTLKRFFS